MRTPLMLAVLFLAVPVMASESVSVRSAVFIETADSASQGKSRSITPASSLQRGDKIVLLVDWRAGRSSAFTITSEVPRHLSFRESARPTQEVSVDGGKSWGQLGEVTLRDRFGRRAARPADVTHLRWRIHASEAALGRGNIAYSATVR